MFAIFLSLELKGFHISFGVLELGLFIMGYLIRIMIFWLFGSLAISYLTLGYLVRVKIRVKAFDFLAIWL